jgi:hypothetical protein
MAQHQSGAFQSAAQRRAQNLYSRDPDTGRFLTDEETAFVEQLSRQYPQQVQQAYDQNVPFAAVGLPVPPNLGDFGTQTGSQHHSQNAPRVTPYQSQKIESQAPPGRQHVESDPYERPQRMQPQQRGYQQPQTSWGQPQQYQSQPQQPQFDDFQQQSMMESQPSQEGGYQQAQPPAPEYSGGQTQPAPQPQAVQQTGDQLSSEPGSLQQPQASGATPVESQPAPESLEHATGQQSEPVMEQSPAGPSRQGTRIPIQQGTPEQSSQVPVSGRNQQFNRPESSEQNWRQRWYWWPKW